MMDWTKSLLAPTSLDNNGRLDDRKAQQIPRRRQTSSLAAIASSLPIHHEQTISRVHTITNKVYRSTSVSGNARVQIGDHIQYHNHYYESAPSLPIPISTRSHGYQRSDPALLEALARTLSDADSILQSLRSQSSIAEDAHSTDYAGVDEELHMDAADPGSDDYLEQLDEEGPIFKLEETHLDRSDGIRSHGAVEGGTEDRSTCGKCRRRNSLTTGSPLQATTDTNPTLRYSWQDEHATDIAGAGEGMVLDLDSEHDSMAFEDTTDRMWVQFKRRYPWSRSQHIREVVLRHWHCDPSLPGFNDIPLDGLHEQVWDIDGAEALQETYDPW